MAAQIVTLTESGEGVKLIKWAWTSATGGAVSSQTVNHYDGKLISLVTNPGATAPTDNYDVVINDDNSEDVLVGAGVDRDTANTELVNGTTLGAVANSRLTLVISNAGDEKLGVVYLYIR